MEDLTYIKQLFEKYLAGTQTASEQSVLMVFFDQCADEELLEVTKGQLYEEDTVPADLSMLNDRTKAIFEKIKDKTQLPASPPVKTTQRHIGWMFIAAALLLVVLSTALYFYLSRPRINHPAQLVSEIAPGGNRAASILRIACNARQG